MQLLFFFLFSSFFLFSQNIDYDPKTGTTREYNYDNGQLKIKDKYTFLGEYKSSKCFINCSKPAKIMKNYYNLKE